jgi:hypothetical protein
LYDKYRGSRIRESRVFLAWTIFYRNLCIGLAKKQHFLPPVTLLATFFFFGQFPGQFVMGLGQKIILFAPKNNSAQQVDSKNSERAKPTTRLRSLTLL